MTCCNHCFAKEECLHPDCYCHEPMAESYLQGKRLIQTFSTIERCEEALKNLEKTGHQYRVQLSLLVEARKQVIYFDSL